MLHGQSVYGRDNPNWAPFPYPPAHSLVIALLGFVRIDFWTGRLVSIVFFALLCYALFSLIHRHLCRSSIGVALGVGVLTVVVCSYPVIGQWYDLSRVDTMMVALVALGLLRLSFGSWTWPTLLQTALVFTAAIYTKQTAALIVAWACLFVAVRNLKAGIELSTLLGAMCLLTLGVLQITSHGGFWVWTVAGLESHKVDDARITEGLLKVREYAPFVVLIPFLPLLLSLTGKLSQRTVLWIGAFLMSVPASLLPYAKAGGFLNNLMPMLVFCGPAIVLPLADVATDRRRTGNIARWCTLLGLALFAWQRPLNVSAYIPTDNDRRAAHELNTIAQGLSGGLVVPYLEYLPGRNGHDNPHWHSMVVWDSIWRGEPMSEVRALQASGARWVMLHSKDVGVMASFVRHTSRLHMRIPASARIRMLTGNPVVIDEVWDRGNGHSMR